MKIYDDLLAPNPYNFPGLEYTPQRIVIHYTGDCGASADRLSLFFNNTAAGMFKNAKNPINTSCNYIVGWDGKIIRKAKDNQMTYSVSNYNIGTIAIEVCYNTATGEFSEEAIEALGELVPYLQDAYNIDADHVVRHYDLTRKQCPLYYVDEAKWKNLKNRIVKNEKKYMYKVQVGAFTSRANAENYLKQAKAKGFANAYIVRGEV